MQIGMWDEFWTKFLATLVAKSDYRALLGNLPPTHSVLANSFSA